MPAAQEGRFQYRDENSGMHGLEFQRGNDHWIVETRGSRRKADPNLSAAVVNAELLLE